MPLTDIRFFTSNWTITLPSHPHLKFIRLTPSNIDSKIKLALNPANDVLHERQNWDAQKIQEFKDKTLARYYGSKTLHNALDLLVLYDDEIVGTGGAYQIDLPIPVRLANIGLGLNPEVRGRGVGRALLELLLRLSGELDVDVVHLGTMKTNVAMRALARKVGLEETEKILEVPGRGIVADILYDDVKPERWAGLEFHVDFEDDEMVEGGI